jgi:L-amino acid N-acyltransferase YncA
MLIRDARDDDLPQILAIYNEVIASSTAVYATDPVPLAERADWVEHSVHVRADARGRRLGAGLVEALLPPARALGMHAMIGAVDAANQGSIRFHERLGFTEVGRFPEVGRKFGRWLDLVFMQRFLDPAGSPR